MKVIINKCYGGFGLSAEAVYLLYKKNSPTIKVMPVKEYYGTSMDMFERDKLRYYIPFKKGILRHKMHASLLKGDNVINYNKDARYEYRNHPDLIWAVEKLGKAANSKYAKLKIVEIPDGVEYEITEYAGIESIHEKHRSWD